jgi:TolB-like protein
LLVAAAIGGAWLWNRPGPVASPAIDSVAVLPFENTSDDPEIDYIGDGVTDGLIDHLSRVRSLKVMARATVNRFKDQDDPRQAARTLGVGSVVTGAVSRRGGQIVISAELIHGTTGERLWGQSFDRPAADLMRVQDAIVASIADGLRLRLTGEEKARLAGFGTNNPEAYDLVLKGRYLLQKDTEEDDLEARRLFELAAEKDPNFVDAHLAILGSHARSAGSGYATPAEAEARVDAAVAKVAALDPNNVAGDAAIHQDAQLGRDRAGVSRRDARPERAPHESIPPDRALPRRDWQARRSGGAGRARAGRRSGQSRIARDAG